jgi:UDPglucose 6-dehydrogenase
MRITIVGTGYVGLVTGCCLAESDHTVICVDNNDSKVAALRRGEIPIYEPGLEEMMQHAQKLNTLSFTTDLAEGLKDTQLIFLALPTPPLDDGSADLSAILAVADQLGEHLPDNYCVVVNKSTVPVGTAEKVRETIAAKAKTEFDVVSNPEFLREGHAVEDFMQPERVVVGSDSPKAEAVMRELYAPFIDDDRPLYMTGPRTAELAKYAANTFLVTKVSFMNEIAQLSERMGADIDVLRQAIGSDSRIGHKFLHPGIGCGGSCFPKDVRALKHMSKEYNYDFKLLTAAMAINDQQQQVLVDKLSEHFQGNVQGKTFALWGLAFKPQTDDIREAPALVIIDQLLAKGAKVAAYDPEAGANVRARYADNKSVMVVDEKYQALENASALLIATEWPEFAGGDLERVKKTLKEAVIFDGRNVFKPEDMAKAGFTYYSIGRRPVQPTP